MKLFEGAEMTEQVLQCNKVQQEFYNDWETLMDLVGPVDSVVGNGDLCEGINVKGQGEGCWSPVRATQINTCAELLGMIDTKEFTIINGTPYHTGVNPSNDAGVASKLRENGFRVKYAGVEEILNIDGVRIHCCHKIGVCGADKKGRVTAISRELQAALLNEKYFGKVNGVFRSHVHYHVYVGMEDMVGMTLPCFKCRDDYAGSQSLNWVPEHGAVLVEVDNGEMSWSHQMFTLPDELKPKDHYI